MAAPQPGREPLSGCLVRIFWLFAGNALLALILIQILFHRPVLSWRDLFYWLVFILILIARYVDVRYLEGTSAEGNPSTLSDWRRHAIRLLIVAGAAWCFVHLAGVFGLSLATS